MPLEAWFRTAVMAVSNMCIQNFCGGELVEKWHSLQALVSPGTPNDVLLSTVFPHAALVEAMLCTLLMLQIGACGHVFFFPLPCPVSCRRSSRKALAQSWNLRAAASVVEQASSGIPCVCFYACELLYV